MNPQIPQNHSVLPLILVLAKRARMLAGVPLLAAVIAVITCKIMDPVYSATARLLPPQYNENTVSGMQNQLGGESQLGNSALTLKNPTDLFVGVLKSRTIVDAVIEDQQLGGHYGVDKGSDLRKKLLQSTIIRAGKDGIVSVTVEDHSPEKSARIANSYVNQFYDFAANMASRQSQRRSEFYAQALVKAQAELKAADDALSESERTTGFTRLTGQDQAIVQAVAELQAEIAAREIQLKTMASYATANNPDVQLIERELTNLRDEMAQMVGTEGKPGIGLAELGGATKALQQHTQRRRQVTYWETIVMLLGRYSELGKIDVTRDMSLFQVLDWAIAPDDKSKPRTRIAAILAILGTGFVCLFWVLASAYVAERRRHSAEFERHWRELIKTIFGLFSLTRTQS